MSDVAPSPINLSGHRLDHGVAAMAKGSVLNEVGGAVEGRKRAPAPATSLPKKKVQKLSPVATRALAALESDSSSSSEDGDGKCSSSAEGQQSPAVDANRDERSTTAKGDGQSSPTSASNDASSNKADAGNTELGGDRSSSGDKEPASLECAPNSHRSENGGVSQKDTEEGAEDSDGDDVVYPHPCNNDVVPFILATPFDGQSMMALHRLKEGIEFDEETAANLVSCSRDRIPIIPQKQFNKFMRERQSIHNQNQAKGSLSSADVSAEVSSFLVGQGNSLLTKPQVSQTPVLSNDDLAPFRYPLPPQQSQERLQMALLTQHLLLSHLAQNSLGFAPQLHSYQLTLAFDALQQPNLGYQQQINEWRHLQNLAALEQLSGGMANAYSDAAALATARAMLLATNGDTQSRISGLAGGVAGPAHNFSTATSLPQTNPTTMHLPQSQSGAQVVHSPAKAAGGANDSKSPVLAAYQAQLANPFTAPKIAVASKEIKASESDAQTTAKMPVAFGFHLDDGASKRLALDAAANWKMQGQRAAKEVQSAKGRRSICGTPKGAKTPGGSTTPKTPRTPAVLLSTKAAPNLPEGWVLKTFKRSSGRTAGGTDKYFFSPQNELKFRSMKAAKVFVQILNEPGVDGKESVAVKLFRERGHKF